VYLALFAVIAFSALPGPIIAHFGDDGVLPLKDAQGIHKRYNQLAGVLVQHLHNKLHTCLKFLNQLRKSNE
jgi:hypothetical protein